MLAGGYEDDEDMGDSFYYTGSGGRDLSGNKRTSGILLQDLKLMTLLSGNTRGSQEGTGCPLTLVPYEYRNLRRPL